jgi:Type I restriction modification DNA specificity domain
MALLTVRKFSDTILELPHTEGELERWNHVLEPEFHQRCYVEACEIPAKTPGAFQLGDANVVTRYPYRGIQPVYADDDGDSDSLEYEGMVGAAGKTVGTGMGKHNVCALKSNVVRFGFLDFGLARSVSREFYEDKKNRSGIQNNDLLINSTGDGTIGRVAVFDQTFPAVVDGHITIVRFKESILAWYAAAYLLSEQGQNQIYRYINGSSGQVEIYPQDIARLWIPVKTKDKMKEIATKLKTACSKHNEFAKDMKVALGML